MKGKNYSKGLNMIGILFLFLFIIVMIIEIVNFTPYNSRMPFFIDRILEFLLPSFICFILARFIKIKEK
jgi:hypothetical protein